MSDSQTGEREEMRLPIICLHIPKTAGTSFRISAEHYFGPWNVVSDYGEKSPATSEEVKLAYYQNKDFELLKSKISQKKFFTGHFSLAKYREHFPDSPVVTFFRDPVKRIISEYVHFTTHYGFEGSLREFYRMEQFRNRQARVLSGAEPTDLDFYGLTEKYQESLDKFNLRYSTKFPMAVLNTGKYTSEGHRATEEEIEEIKVLNQDDLRIYQLAVEQFDQQDDSVRPAIATVPRYSGYLGGVRNEKVIGWTVDRQSDQPVTLRITVNGKRGFDHTADTFRADIQRKGIHINGNCGFEIPLGKLGKVASGDQISVCTQDGAFELPNSPLTIGA
jgi:hypothetical protein